LQTSVTSLPHIQPLAQLTDLSHLNLMISLGGDGTLLETVRYVGSTETPVMGINIGRMSFLATIAQKNACSALEIFWRSKHKLDKRTLLQLEFYGISPPVKTNFALNEVAFLRRDSSSMLTIYVSINGELHTTYWADGLIVATPTGSTGYSLSCGGPIVLPSAHNLVITPVSPHNLSVRPLVVPDNAVLSLTIESRNKTFLVTLDGRSYAINTDGKHIIKRAPFQACLVKTDQSNLFDVLRQKLHWGLDVRN